MAGRAGLRDVHGRVREMKRSGWNRPRPLRNRPAVVPAMPPADSGRPPLGHRIARQQLVVDPGSLRTPARLADAPHAGEHQLRVLAGDPPDEGCSATASAVTEAWRWSSPSEGIQTSVRRSTARVRLM